MAHTGVLNNTDASKMGIDTRVLNLSTINALYVFFSVIFEILGGILCNFM